MSAVTVDAQTKWYSRRPETLPAQFGGEHVEDPALGRYLRRVDGLDAQIWVAPSRGQLFWLRHAPALFGPPIDGGGRLARWWAIATVTPSTNVTGLNLPYQAYLNMVFHRTWLARVGHALCMPVIVAALLAACCPVRLSAVPAVPGLAALTGQAVPVNASLLAAVALAVWWLIWAVKEGHPGWGLSCLVLAAALYTVANAAYALRNGTQPIGWALVASLLQAASHAREPLPPRVTRSTRWLGVGDYLWGTPDARIRPATVARRTGHLAAQVVFGTVDELVASPRLLPILLLDLLWRAGYAQQRRAALTAWATQAITSGNPALDYIGTGGGTPLQVPLDPLPRARQQAAGSSLIPVARRARRRYGCGGSWSRTTGTPTLPTSGGR